MNRVGPWSVTRGGTTMEQMSSTLGSGCGISSACLHLLTKNVNFITSIFDNIVSAICRINITCKYSLEKTDVNKFLLSYYLFCISLYIHAPQYCH